MAESTPGLALKLVGNEVRVMGFFDIGLLELLLILVIALIVFGPGRLPEIARTLGRMVRNLKKMTSDLTAEMTREIDKEEKDYPPQPGESGDDKTEKSNAGKRRHHGRKMTGSGD